MRSKQESNGSNNQVNVSLGSNETDKNTVRKVQATDTLETV